MSAAIHFQAITTGAAGGPGRAKGRAGVVDFSEDEAICQMRRLTCVTKFVYLTDQTMLYIFYNYVYSNDSKVQ